MTSPGRRAAAASVPGCQHVLAGGLPCQDASGTRQAGDRLLLAVSDGHGSPEYPRSDEGARIAVRVALDALEALLDRLAGVPNRHDPDALALEHGPPLVRRIAWAWNRQVKHHHRMMLALDGEPDAIVDPAEAITGDWAEEVRPYGATLLAAAFEPDLAVWLRLGDGDLLAVDASGAQRVFPAADKSMGQATWSLCSRDWVARAAVRFEVPRADLAVLATDGVSDPYGADPSFEDEWGTRLRERILRDGWVGTVLELPRWLGQVARDGDDVTVALAWLGGR